jgi:hypothetical protein
MHRRGEGIENELMRALQQHERRQKQCTNPQFKDSVTQAESRMNSTQKCYKLNKYWRNHQSSLRIQVALRTADKFN